MNKLTSYSIISFAIILVLGGITFHVIKSQQTHIFSNKQPIHHYSLDKSYSFPVPQSAIDAYGELKTYVMVGAQLERCTKNTETIFIVGGGSGFTAKTYYFREDGTLIQEYYSDDTIEPNEPMPLIKQEEYNCITLDSYSPN